MKNRESALVYAKLPKFEYQTDLSLKDILVDMGMEKPFDKETADFSRLGEIQNGNVYIGDVFHSTKISVTEQGTKAGAATAVVKNATGAATRLFEVHLNRPFVYMIVETENYTPVFMGTFVTAE